jgi:hypothetical protein
MAVAIQAMPAFNGLINGHTNGDVDMAVPIPAPEGALRFATGFILPPPEIKCMHFYSALFSVSHSILMYHS